MGRQRFSEVFKRFSEIFRGFQRFFNGFLSETLSEADFPLRGSVLLPLIVLPLELSPNHVSECEHSRCRKESAGCQAWCRNTQKSANEHKRAQTQVRKRAQKAANERKSLLLRKNCKQPGLKQPGWELPKDLHIPPKIDGGINLQRYYMLLICP